GQFEETVEDVMANDEHGVVLVRHRFPRNGRLKSMSRPTCTTFATGACWSAGNSRATRRFSTTPGAAPDFRTELVAAAAPRRVGHPPLHAWRPSHPDIAERACARRSHTPASSATGCSCGCRWSAAHCLKARSPR